MTATAGFKEKIYTIEEYFESEERSQEKHEFYNGKITTMPGGTPIHNEIAAKVIAQLIIAIKTASRKYRVYTSDMKIQIPAENTFVYPDAVVVCENPILYKHYKTVITNPLLIVEVLSKSTEEHDRSTKFDYYRSLPSFQEYVLLSQTRPRASVYHRRGTNTWEIDDITTGVLDLQSIGCQIVLEDIYEDVLFESNEVSENE
jgi:Uma2 family endonuclease